MDCVMPLRGTRPPMVRSRHDEDRLDPSDLPAPDRPTEPETPRLGLRLRLWAVALASAAVTGVGTLWVLGTQVDASQHPELATLLAWLSGVAFLSVVVGAALALWLDHHVIGNLRALLRGIRSGRVAELRGVPAASGWGELSELGDQVQSLLGRRRGQTRSTEELTALRAQLASLQSAVETWEREERFPEIAPMPGEVGELAERLSHGLARRGVIDEQNREAARQVAAELVGSLADAQESAEQAERGFVEATALLTTVRELQRLSAELQNAHAALATPGAQPSDAGDARSVLEELVEASHGSVESLGRALLSTQDVADQVQTLANRSTLIAIQVLTSGAHAGAGDEVGGELKQLAADVRAITDRTAQDSADIEAAVHEATTRMRDARARAIERLEASGAPTVAPGARGMDDANRLLERVREMVQDAARKGERLSAAGERSSRAAERLARRLESESAEVEALHVRLSPVEEPLPAPAERTATGLRLFAHDAGRGRSEGGEAAHETDGDDDRAEPEEQS